MSKIPSDLPCVVVLGVYLVLSVLAICVYSGAWSTPGAAYVLAICVYSGAWSTPGAVYVLAICVYSGAWSTLVLFMCWLYGAWSTLVLFMCWLASCGWLSQLGCGGF